MPHQTVERYVKEKKTSNIIIWKFSNKYTNIPKGSILRIHCLASAIVRWTTDDWETYNETSTLDSGIGVHFADLPTHSLVHDQKINFTFYWNDSENWENRDYTLSIERFRQKPVLSEDIVKEKKNRNKTKIYYPS